MSGGSAGREPLTLAMIELSMGTRSSCRAELGERPRPWCHSVKQRLDQRTGHRQRPAFARGRGTQQQQQQQQQRQLQQQQQQHRQQRRHWATGATRLSGSGPVTYRRMTHILMTQVAVTHVLLVALVVTAAEASPAKVSDGTGCA